MTSLDDVRGVEALLVRWNSLHSMENTRRDTFVAQRDEALKRWREQGAHTDADEHYVEFRLSRSVATLAEVIELDDRCRAAFASCQVDLKKLTTQSAKEQKRSLARTRDLAASAIRQDMRYLAALTASFQSEVDQMVSFMLEREND